MRPVSPSNHETAVPEQRRVANICHHARHAMRYRLADNEREGLRCRGKKGNVLPRHQSWHALAEHPHASGQPQRFRTCESDAFS